MATVYSFGESGELTTFILEGTRIIILEERDHINGGKPVCVFDEYLDPDGYLKLLEHMSSEHDLELKNDDATDEADSSG